jgi:high-affinity nickel-transport protein
MGASALSNAKAIAARYHKKVPYIRNLPAATVGIILALVFVNAVVWAGVGIVLVRFASIHYRRHD